MGECMVKGTKKRRRRGEFRVFDLRSILQYGNAMLLNRSKQAHAESQPEERVLKEVGADRECQNYIFREPSRNGRQFV